MCVTLHCSFTEISWTITFPDRHFPDKTFPGHLLSRTDVSRTSCTKELYTLIVGPVDGCSQQHDSSSTLTALTVALTRPLEATHSAREHRGGLWSRESRWLHTNNEQVHGVDREQLKTGHSAHQLTSPHKHTDLNAAAVSLWFRRTTS